MKKSTKNMLILAVSVLGLFGFSELGAMTDALLKKIQGPGFEIFNKASQPITIAVLIDGQLTSAEIGAGQKFLKDVDVSKTIRLGIYNSKPKSSVSTAMFSDAITPQPDVIYDLNGAKKTKYVTWNPAKAPFLYPQSGPLMGYTGKSDSGYPLGSNIVQSEIILKK